MKRRAWKFWQKAYALTLGVCVLALGSSAAALGALSWQRSYDAEIGRLLAAQHAAAQDFVLDAAAVYARRPSALNTLALNYAAEAAREGALVRIEQDGKTLADTLPAPDAPLPEAPAAGSRVHAVRAAQGRRYLFVTARLPGPPDELTLTLAYDTEPFFAEWEDTWRTLALAGAAVLALLAVALYAVLRGLSRPMERLAAAAGRIAAGDYSVRCGPHTGDETGQLAAALDEMAARVQQTVCQLEDAAQRKQQLVDNVAHELRTPLTAIGGYADYLQRAALTPQETGEAAGYIAGETKRLAAMSDRLLQMAALRGETAARDDVDVPQLARAAARTVAPKADAHGVVLRVKPIPACTVPGEAPLLESLLVNLLDNAVKACEAGGRVTLGAQADAHSVRLWVQDTGCGMDRETLAHIGDPFYRPDKARSRRQGGAGLGLALCFAIAKAHGARLTFSSRPGHGTTASVLFTTL